MPGSTTVVPQGSRFIEFGNVQIDTTVGGSTLVAERLGRRRVTVKNEDSSASAYIGNADATVTSTSGRELKAGESETYETQAGLKALSSSGTIRLSYVEEYD